MNMPQPTDPNLATLSRLFSAATENASEAMGRWTQGEISLSLDEVREVAIEDVATETNIGDDLLTMIVMGLDGDLGGQLILTFDEDNGRQLAASLLGRETGSEPEWTELEQSALKETGNILACAYMRVLTDVIEANLVPTPPYFIQDFGASILEQAVMAQAMVSDRLLICRTVFKRDGKCLNWNIFFVPTEELLTALNNSFESAV